MGKAPTALVNNIPRISFAKDNDPVSIATSPTLVMAL
jgi:hypothetical protein